MLLLFSMAASHAGMHVPPAQPCSGGHVSMTAPLQSTTWCRSPEHDTSLPHGLIEPPVPSGPVEPPAPGAPPEPAGDPVLSLSRPAEQPTTITKPRVKPSLMPLSVEPMADAAQRTWWAIKLIVGSPAAGSPHRV